MLRYSLRRAVGAATTGGFSSAAFTGEDGGAYERLKSEKERLELHNINEAGASRARTQDSPRTASGGGGGGAASSSSSSSAFSSASFSSSSFTHSSSSSAGKSTADPSTVLGATDADRPTIDTYRAMTDSELVDVLRLRDTQIAQLRTIYESFHYDVDKHFRKMIFDYHDKTMQLSQVHGKMQQASLQINREALSKMRDEQDRMTRDKRLIYILCTIWTVVFWVWVRRHYVKARELERVPQDLAQRGEMSPSVTGVGSYGNNLFGSSKRSGRFIETAWEREVRERREAKEAQERQLALLRHQEEVARAVAARDGATQAADTKESPSSTAAKA